MIIEFNYNQKTYLDDEFLPLEKVEKELSENPFGKYLLYIENDELIGYIYYSDIYDRAEINQFEIKENHRSCGKGTKLLKKLLESVEKSFTLEVKKDNLSAITVYKKCGFVEKALRKGYYNGTDGILMEREVERVSL